MDPVPVRSLHFASQGHLIRDDIAVRLAGESGEGVISGGDILTTGAARTGYWALTFRTYPAEIKGGPCMYQVRVGADACARRATRWTCWSASTRRRSTCTTTSWRTTATSSATRSRCGSRREFESRSSEVPLGGIAQEAGGGRRGKNMVAVGLVCGLLGIDTARIEEMILKRYAHKGDVGEANIRSLLAGAGFARDQLPAGGHTLSTAERASEAERVLLSGNQAICLGALHAGLNYYAGYPITPASDILEWLAGRLPKFGGVAIQTEDEIAALASVLGASFAGQEGDDRDLGPGPVADGGAGRPGRMAEIPAVIVDAQRSGPSTGMPTKTEQSDLNHALYGGHGESPRVVMAPTSVEDCFRVIVEAFNAAERFQVPVIVLSDQSLSHRMETVRRPDLDDRGRSTGVRPDGERRTARTSRYEIRPDGVSPMAIPGGRGAYVSTGIEHDEAGNPHYEPELHEAMMAKRFRKLEPLARDGRITISGPEQADSASSAGDRPRAPRSRRPQICLDRGLKVAHLLPARARAAAGRADRGMGRGHGRIVVPELNVTGQFARLVRSDVGHRGGVGHARPPACRSRRTRSRTT